MALVEISYCPKCQRKTRHNDYRTPGYIECDECAARAEKVNKVLPVEVSLGTCTECGAAAVNPHNDHCMKCGSAQRIGGTPESGA